MLAISLLQLYWPGYLPRSCVRSCDGSLPNESSSELWRWLRNLSLGCPRRSLSFIALVDRVVVQKTGCWWSLGRAVSVPKVALRERPQGREW